MIPKRHLTIFSIRKDFFQAFDFFPSFEPQWWSNCPNMSSAKVDNSSYDSLGNPSYIFHQVLKGRTDTIMFFFCFYVVLLGRLSLTLQKGGSIWGTFRRGHAAASTFDCQCTEDPIKSWHRGYICYSNSWENVIVKSMQRRKFLNFCNKEKQALEDLNQRTSWVSRGCKFLIRKAPDCCCCYCEEMHIL